MVMPVVRLYPPAYGLPDAVSAAFQGLRQALEGMPEDQVRAAAPAIRGQLADLATFVLLRAMPPAPSTDRAPADEWLTAEQAAARVHVDPSWFKRQRVPFARRLGRKTVRYSAAGLERWMASRPRTLRDGP